MSSQMRGQMVPKGPDKWLLRVFTGRVAGKKKYSSKTVVGTTAQARQALTAMLREVDTKTFVAKSSLTLGAYLDKWLEGKIDVSSRTRVSYEYQLEHVKDLLGDVRLTDLDRDAIQGLVSQLVALKKSPRTISYTVRVLRGALEDAIRAGTLVRNPSTYVRVPQQVKRAASILTMEQASTLLEKTSAGRLGPLWRLLLTTGMRPQEAFALAWSDLDLDAGWVNIRRSLVGDGKGRTSIKEAAKADSQRRIGLPESTSAALKEHRKRQAEEIMLAGKHYDRQGLVFANAVGRPLDINRVRRHWKAALKAAKLPTVRLYDTRHSHLTALLAGGADIAWVAARAGHKDISMTRDHYAHVMQETHREMGQMTERLMETARKKAEEKKK